MSNLSLHNILKKYEKVIQEEMNVKEVSVFEKHLSVSKIFKPLGSSLSQKFGKDTWSIIQNWKSGNVEELWNGSLRVFDGGGNEWILDSGDYEIAYQWLEWDYMIADWDMIVGLDLNITEDLRNEWIAREISRFLNQMRKEADFAVDDKVDLFFSTESDLMFLILENFGDFLQGEALLNSLQKVLEPDWKIVSLFELDWENITFAMIV